MKKNAFFKLQVIEKRGASCVLGYALEISKVREGANIVPAGEFPVDIPCEPGDALLAEAESVEVVKVNGLHGVKLDGLTCVYNLDKRKPECTNEIIQKAYDSKILKLTDAIRDELVGCKLLKCIVDRELNLMIPLTKDVKRQLVFGVIMEPFDGTNKDLDGDYATAEEIEKAAMLYGEEFGFGTSYMHERRADDEIVTVFNFIAPCDYVVGIDKIRKGSWVIGQHIKNPVIWKDVEDGVLTGFSVNGECSVGPVIKRDLEKRGPGGNMMNIRISDISVVDKGANGKRYYLIKNKKEQPMKKELAIILIKSTKDPEVQKQIIAACAEADRPELEALTKAAPAKTENDPVVLSILADISKRLAAIETAKPVEKKDDKKPEPTEAERIQKCLDNPNEEVPADILDKVIAKMAESAEKEAAPAK